MVSVKCCAWWAVSDNLSLVRTRLAPGALSVLLGLVAGCVAQLVCPLGPLAIQEERRGPGKMARTRPLGRERGWGRGTPLPLQHPGHRKLSLSPGT